MNRCLTIISILVFVFHSVVNGQIGSVNIQFEYAGDSTSVEPKASRRSHNAELPTVSDVDDIPSEEERHKYKPPIKARRDESYRLTSKTQKNAPPLKSSEDGPPLKTSENEPQKASENRPQKTSENGPRKTSENRPLKTSENEPSEEANENEPSIEDKKKTESAQQAGADDAASNESEAVQLEHFRAEHSIKKNSQQKKTNKKEKYYPPKPALRIRGGNITTFLNSPYMAAILINGRLWCAGAIVDENWVITAAHCLNYVLHISPMKSLENHVKVRVGSELAYSGGFLVGVAGAIRHPKFEEEPVPHADVALLKLAKNLPFTKTVNLIKVYDGMSQPYAQSFIVVAGWGARRGSVNAFQDATQEMMTTRLKVRTQHYCSDAYQLVNKFEFTSDFFCASLRKGARDACLFDAGAPAVQQNRLVGIMSFGPEHCGNSNQPAVFIKAFYFRDFVKHTISSYKTTKDLLEAIKEVPDDEIPTVPPRTHLRSPEANEQPSVPEGLQEQPVKEQESQNVPT